MIHIKLFNEDLKHINVNYGKGKSGLGQLYKNNDKYYVCDIPQEDKFIEISRELYSYLEKLRGY